MPVSFNSQQVLDDSMVEYLFDIGDPAGSIEVVLQPGRLGRGELIPPAHPFDTDNDEVDDLDWSDALILGPLPFGGLRVAPNGSLSLDPGREVEDSDGYRLAGKLPIGREYTGPGYSGGRDGTGESSTSESFTYDLGRQQADVGIVVYNFFEPVSANTRYRRGTGWQGDRSYQTLDGGFAGKGHILRAAVFVEHEL